MRRLLPLIACMASAGFAAQVSADEGYARLEGHGGPVRGLSIGGGGDVLYSASFDNSIGVWSLSDLSGEPRWLDGHEAATNDAAWIREGDRTVSAGDDGTIRIWSIADDPEILTGHTARIADILNTGSEIISASWDGTVGFWPFERGGSSNKTEAVRNSDRKRVHRMGVTSVATALEAGLLYSSSMDGTVHLWELDGRKPIRAIIKHGFGVNRVVADADNRWIAYGAVDGTVRIFEPESGEQIADFTTERKPILAMAHHPMAGRLAVGDGDGHIHVIDTENWTTIRDFRATPKGPVWSLAFHPDGKRLFAGTLADHIDLWPIETAESVVEADAPFREFHRAPETMSNGERQFMRKCSICHTLTPDGGRRAGPSLYRVFGRRAGTLKSYSYSEALTDIDLIWSAATLDKLFDIGPDHYTPGSKMPMQRIVRDEDRADLIAFLKEATGGGQLGENEE